MSNGPISTGERLVAAYLRQRGFSWEHEPDVGGRNPDFLASTPGGPVVLEVFEPELHLAGGSGWFDPIKPLQGLTSKRKKKQIQAIKGAGYPLIMVVGSAKSDIAFDVTAVAGFMFGHPGVAVPLGFDGGPRGGPQWTFLGGARLQQGMNTGISAVAVVQGFNPTLWRLHSAWRLRGLIDRGSARDGHEQDAIYERMEDIRRDLASRGLYDETARVARLVIAHNPYAEHPLVGFAGPHDEEWRVDGDGENGLWGLAACGSLIGEVPGGGR